MKNSIVSYENRGHYGKSNWRSNCSGHFVKEILEYYQPKVFVDPTVGSGTSADVIAEMRKEGSDIEFYGLEHSGFNILKDSLSERIGGKRADYIFTHPPYHSVIPK